MLRPLVLSLALATAVAVPSALASAPASATVEEPAFDDVSLMHVSGELTADVEGRVTSVKVDTRLDENQRAAIERTVLKMRFKPTLVGGVPQSVRTHYDLVIAARPAIGREGYEVTIDRTSFHPVKGTTVVRADGDDYSFEIESAGHMTRPRFPQSAQSNGAMGRVVLALRYSADGKVTDSAVISSMLYKSHISDANGRRALAQFEKAALEAAQYWRAKIVPGPKPPPHGYTATVAVDFSLVQLDLDAEGQWLPVRRLPSRPIPWVQQDDKAEVPDSGFGSGFVALGGGGVELVQSARGTPVL